MKYIIDAVVTIKAISMTVSSGYVQRTGFLKLHSIHTLFTLRSHAYIWIWALRDRFPQFIDD